MRRRRRAPRPTAAADRHAGAGGGARAASLARAREAREAARLAEARRLRRSSTVKGALRRAWLARAISRARYEELRRTWWLARRDVGRLRGTRRAELRVGRRDGRAAGASAPADRRPAGPGLPDDPPKPRVLDDAAAAGAARAAELPRRSGRLRVLRRPRAGDPAAGDLRPGQRARRGVRALEAPYRCRPAALRRLLDRMLDLATQRDGFLAWEHFFAFGSGAPPWISAMTQATGAQAMARGAGAPRGAGLRGGRRYARAALGALGAFEAPPPPGVAVAGGRRRALRDVLLLAEPADPQRRAADADRPARRRADLAQQPRAAPVRARRAGRAARRCAASTPAPGRCTAPAAGSRRSATTGSSRSSSAGCAGAPARRCTASPAGASSATCRAAARRPSERRASCAPAGVRRSASRCRRSPTSCCRCATAAVASSARRACGRCRAAATASAGCPRARAATGCGSSRSGRPARAPSCGALRVKSHAPLTGQGAQEAAAPASRARGCAGTACDARVRTRAAPHSAMWQVDPAAERPPA